MLEKECKPEPSFAEVELPGPKIGVISDLHSNYEALCAVLEKIEEESVDAIIVAGDHVGYYTQINETIEKMARLGSFSIMGNHDFATIESCPITTSFLNPYAQVAIEYTKHHISVESHSWLVKLPLRMRLTYNDTSILVVHGHPEKPFEYMIGYNEKRTIEMIKETLEKTKEDILITGHTHLPRVINEGKKWYLNPGSVGQPRDKNPRASYAIMNVEKKEFRIERVGYDIDAIKELVEKALLPDYLWKRLYEGV